MVAWKRCLCVKWNRTSSPWHNAVRTSTKPPRLLCVPPLSGMLHSPLHKIIGTEVSPILAVEVVEFGTGGEPAIRTTKFLLYLDFVATLTFALWWNRITIAFDRALRQWAKFCWGIPSSADMSTPSWRRMELLFLIFHPYRDIFKIIRVEKFYKIIDEQHVR